VASGPDEANFEPRPEILFEVSFVLHLPPLIPATTRSKPRIPQNFDPATRLFSILTRTLTRTRPPYLSSPQLADDSILPLPDDFILPVQSPPLRALPFHTASLRSDSVSLARPLSAQHGYSRLHIFIEGFKKDVNTGSSIQGSGPGGLRFFQLR